MRAARVVRPALLIVVLLLAVKVIAGYTNGTGTVIRKWIRVAMTSESTGFSAASGSARLILATLAVAAVTVALDRIARR